MYFINNYWKIFFTIFLAIFIICFYQKLKANERTVNISYKFSVVNNKLIVKIPTNDGNTKNFIFDSASNDFLLNEKSNYENNIEITDVNRIVPLPNGNINGKLFVNKDLFKDSLLNSFYTDGAILNLDWLSQNAGMHIDGLIGVTQFMKIVLSLNFERNVLSFLDKIPNNDLNSNVIKLDMVYSDNGYESQFSHFLRRTPAVKVKCYISDKSTIETNLLFDTGFNKNIALLTNLDVDSFVVKIEKPLKIDLKKRTSLGEELRTIYTVSADSIHIDGFNGIIPNTLTLGGTSDIALSMFGNSKWMGLVGLMFMERFEFIYFDFLENKIYLKAKT